MREKKPQEGEIILGVCAKGVIVYEIKDGGRSASQNFYWRETATISSTVSSAMFIIDFVFIKLLPKLKIRSIFALEFCAQYTFFPIFLQRCKFVVESRASKKKYTFITERSKIAKYLCNLCSAQHKFNNEMNSRQLTHNLVSGQLQHCCRLPELLLCEPAEYC